MMTDLLCIRIEIMLLVNGYITLKTTESGNFSFGWKRDTTFGRNRNYTERDHPLSAEIESAYDLSLYPRVRMWTWINLNLACWTICYNHTTHMIPSTQPDNACSHWTGPLRPVTQSRWYVNETRPPAAVHAAEAIQHVDSCCKLGRGDECGGTGHSGQVIRPWSSQCLSSVVVVLHHLWCGSGSPYLMISPALVPAEIRHHGCRNRNVIESVTATFDRNRNYAKSVTIYSFGAELYITPWNKGQ